MKSDDLDPKSLSRRGDPPTSKEAAYALYESGALGERKAFALGILIENPGSTAAELDLKAGTPAGGVRKRLNDLKKDHYAYVAGVRRCRVTGRRAQIWWPTA